VLEGVKCEYYELSKEEWHKLLTLENLLITHLTSSPSFMPYSILNEADFLKNLDKDVRFFVAKGKDKCVAFIKISREGENFVCNDKGIMNICGAYCLPEYRGTGIYSNLLAYLVSNLKTEGYTRVGVDFESFNPTARGFWLKHFTEYTNSVVRRIDDKNLNCL
jgi:GNAT superfamily N-acetyltransferase